MEVSVDGRLGSQLTYGVSANLYRSQFDGSALGVPGMQTSVGVDAKLKLDYQPTTRDTVQLRVSRTDRQIDLQGYIGAINVVNAGYRHQVRPGLAALVTATNVFNSQRTQSFVTTPDFTTEMVRTIRGPILYAGVVHSFGGKPAKPPDFQYEKP